MNQQGMLRHSRSNHSEAGSVLRFDGVKGSNDTSA